MIDDGYFNLEECPIDGDDEDVEQSDEDDEEDEIENDKENQDPEEEKVYGEDEGEGGVMEIQMEKEKEDENVGDNVDVEDNIEEEIVFLNLIKYNQQYRLILERKERKEQDLKESIKRE